VVISLGVCRMTKGVSLRKKREINQKETPDVV